MPSKKPLPFALRRSRIQGRGAFATRLIRKGQRVVEYKGERISNEEADRRYDEARMRRHHTFLFVLDRKTIIDGATKGNDAAYINHSCDPNCEAVTEGKQIFIYALKTIRPGEELAYDYSYPRTGDAAEDDERERFYPCRCGAPTCRGTILAPKRKKRAKPPAKRTVRRKATARKKKVAARKTGTQKKEPTARKKRASTSRHGRT